MFALVANLSSLTTLSTAVICSQTHKVSSWLQYSTCCPKGTNLVQHVGIVVAFPPPHMWARANPTEIPDTATRPVLGTVAANDLGWRDAAR